MTDAQSMLAAATVCAALGLWLMLPRGGARGRRLGIVFSAISLGLFFWQMPPIADLGTYGVFLPTAVVTVVSCGASVTARNPVYSAIWFGLALLGTAALFLLQGAQFLGVATVVVYAGAILVTFLFVLMLAQPEGQAFYDRLSWEALLSAVTGAVVLGIVVTMIGAALSNGNSVKMAASADVVHAENATVDALRTDQEAAEGETLTGQHVAKLGGQLFSRHLIAVEVAGTLLLAALVGAVAIVAQGVEPRKGTQQGRASDA